MVEAVVMAMGALGAVGVGELVRRAVVGGRFERSLAIEVSAPVRRMGMGRRGPST